MNSIRKLFFIFNICLIATSLSAKSLPDIKVPKYMKVELISENALNYGGFKVRSYGFQSSKENPDIFKFYKKYWNNKIKTVETDKWFYHSHYDGKYLFSVQVKKSRKKIITSGFIGISEPTSIRKKNRSVESFYPVSSSQVKLSDLSGLDMGKKSRTTVFDAPGSASSNLLHYKLHFENKGWKESNNKLSKEMLKRIGGASLIMQKGSDELVLSFIPDKKGRTQIVGVYVEK